MGWGRRLKKIMLFIDGEGEGLGEGLVQKEKVI